MFIVHMEVFLYEDILEPKWIFVIHYDPILRHVFGDASMNTKQHNDNQQIIDDGLGNIE